MDNYFTTLILYLILSSVRKNTKNKKRKDMKLSLKKLSQSGFSHFELLVIIGVTIVVAGVGTFVYSKVHKSHAGGYNYTYVGSAIAKTNPIDFYACKQLNQGGQTFTYNFFAQNFSSKIVIMYMVIFALLNAQ